MSPGVAVLVLAGAAGALHEVGRQLAADRGVELRAADKLAKLGIVILTGFVVVVCGKNNQLRIEILMMPAAHYYAIVIITNDHGCYPKDFKS